MNLIFIRLVVVVVIARVVISILLLFLSMAVVILSTTELWNSCNQFTDVRIDGVFPRRQPRASQLDWVVTSSAGRHCLLYSVTLPMAGGRVSLPQHGYSWTAMHDTAFKNIIPFFPHENYNVALVYPPRTQCNHRGYNLSFNYIWHIHWIKKIYIHKNCHSYRIQIVYFYCFLNLYI